MKILHITDSHGTVKSPESRTDLFYLTFLRKLAEITYVVKLHKIDMIIHTGDLFHTSRVSNKFMGQVAEIIKGWKVPLYVVPGNHDIDGYTIDTIDQTSLGLLAKTGILTLLTRDNPISVESEYNGQKFSVAISGQEYYSEIDTGNMSDFEMQQDEADINILAVHSYIADTQQHPNIRCTYPKDIVTDANIVLCGHYHRSFALDVGDVAYYNPGSMMRVEMTEYNKTHMPQYGVLEIELDEQGCLLYDYQFHKFRIAKPSSAVFDFNSSGVIKKYGITLENFKISIANTMQNISVNLGATPIQTIENLINEYCTNKQYDTNKLLELKNNAHGIYKIANQLTMDEDVIAVKGFVPSGAPIKIKSIDIENFQSHENTHIDFNDELNIIVGESNNGKTSILRAMDWVVDNQPLGTDFIMTGKNYCKVKITYDNCTFIERYRTLKDTGYYRVGYIAGGQEIYQEYKGFTNNVPVEVMNVHQMPKTIITKNIETHLNKISQLERPFLITENTNEKAAAIGRITGTNVIDTAIKQMNSDITTDKKILKNNIKDKEDLENKIKLIDINKLNSLKNFYTKSNDKISELNNYYINGVKIKKSYDDCNNYINHQNNIINKNELIIKDKEEIDNTERLIKYISHLINLFNKYNNIKTKVNKLQNKIDSYEENIKQKDIINSCDNVITTIQSLMSLLKKKSSVEGLIITCKQRIDILNQMTISSKDINDAILNCDKLKQLLELYKLNEVKQNIIQGLNDDSSGLLGIVNNLSLELQQYQNNMEEYVLSNKICPCCGQKITNENVSSIINNFSREV